MEKEIQVVGFRIGSETYGVRIGAVREIVRVPEITTVPSAPDACSSTAELISCVISVSRLVAFAICEEPTDCSFVAAPISCENL